MDPILIIQMHRLGDLVLTFPLMLDLQRRFPQCPIWMVAEPDFFSGLMPLAPHAVFFPPSHLPALARTKFTGIINLDSSPRAAACAGQASAQFRLGLTAGKNSMRMHGFWHLYRASLTHNNRHNLFHWADLNRLDLGFPPLAVNRVVEKKAKSGRVGLFTGASEPAKRPDASFWSSLARRLAAQGASPVLLGGRAEKDFGAEIAARTGLKSANFCGKTTLAQLAEIISSLDLLITPDTGPMHLADWLGAPVLNLSMGNVSAPETGPLSAGQLVMRARMSCCGCWQCDRPKLYCRQNFNAGAVARVARAFMAGEIADFSRKNPLPGLELLATDRDGNGLRSLAPVLPAANPACGALLDRFWQSAFLHFHRPETDAGINQASAALAARFPLVARNMRKNFAEMLADLSACARAGGVLSDEFWKKRPRHSRILAGNIHMSLQNDNFARPAILEACDRLARLQELFAAAS